MSGQRRVPSYEELAELVALQAKRIAELEAEVAELRRRLGLNSTNSSKPPSSDGLDRPKRRHSGVEDGRAGRRRGKQRGAPGVTRRLVEDPDETVEHRPTWCGNQACGASLADAVEYARQRRQVFELPPVRPYVTEHQLVSLQCEDCGQVTEADSPAGVMGRVQYGPGVKAAVTYGRGAQFLPHQRVARLLADLLGVEVSVGFAHQVISEAARRLGPFVSHVAAALHLQKVLHVDETPTRVDGKLKYVHVACTDSLTLFHVGGRAAADVDAGGVLPGFDGTLVRDGYAAYQHLVDADHAWCGAHLLRDLRGVHESDPQRQSWAVKRPGLGGDFQACEGGSHYACTEEVHRRVA